MELGWISDPFEKIKITEMILRSLPKWFGIESAIRNYIADCPQLPLLAAFQNNRVVGFISLKEHNIDSSEIYLIAVLPELHRQNIGTTLLREAEKFLQEKGISYLQVKTLDSSEEYTEYLWTLSFYIKMGFVPLEVFPNLWGPGNPCLQLIKKIK